MEAISATSSQPPRRVRQPLVEPLTLREVSRALDQSLVTLHNWRRGLRKRRPLAFQSSPRGENGAISITIREAELVQWLRDYRPDLLTRWNMWRDRRS